MKKSDLRSGMVCQHRISEIIDLSLDKAINELKPQEKIK